MVFPKKRLICQILCFLLSLDQHCSLATDEHEFVVKEASYTRLCSTKKILTVNGQYPGPTLQVLYGETVFLNIYNQGKHNITIHWHGVQQPRYPWSDGPEYITQCPIQPGGRFRQKVIFSMEEGTLWWHAHSDWSRATVYGAIIIHPKIGNRYPFPKPDAEVPIILGEWWKEDIAQLRQRIIKSGGDPNVSDAFTINGQPGDLYPCSKQGTFKLTVYRGKTYLLRLINASMTIILFFAIKKHNLTVVGPNGTRFAASMNNISFTFPSTALLQAYYQHVNGVYGNRFPNMPPFIFNFTAKYLPLNLKTPKRGTEVMFLDYNSTVEIVLQGANLMAGIDHPIHLHGYNFYIVGSGFGNFDIYSNPLKYNLKDPLCRNTVSMPVNGWTTLRFKADNLGVWLLHCHMERHMTWGMKTVLIVKDGGHPEERLLPPPPDMPQC
ncbi:hypothetical protein CRYUN_Cryun35bG0087000 [Craigia yunnanensis]